MKAKNAYFASNFGRLIGLVAVLLGLSLSLSVALADLGDPDFSTLQFRNRWVEQDRLVGTAGITRPFTWGPAVGAGAEGVKLEAYRESPNGQRQVQYFDKGRMEINQPFTNGQVTTGLLVRDLVSGRRQDGDNTFLNLPPSQTQVAGDDVSINPDTPVYASFQNQITFGTPDAHSIAATPGATIKQLIAKSGQVSLFNPPQSLTLGTYQAETGHNIAQVFEDFKNLRGPTTDSLTGNRLEDQPIYTSNPTVNVFGYAVTEPYWVRTKVAGVDQTVLVQLFQRRVLTYNPALTGQKVEMGNLGQHYYKWRYIENAGQANPSNAAPDLKCLPATTTDLTVQACVSDTSPSTGSNVTLYGRLIVNGQPVSGAAMSSRWEFFGRVETCDAQPSDSQGLAQCSLNIGTDSGGYQVTVEVSFKYSGRTYQTTVEFKPR